MGYMRHHAILVTSWDRDKIRDAQTRAMELSVGSNVRVSSLSDPVMNGYSSFAVFPDGSKEGWSTSHQGDDVRALIIEHLHSYCYEDGGNPLKWVLIQYGDDNHDDRVLVTDHSIDTRSGFLHVRNNPEEDLGK